MGDIMVKYPDYSEHERKVLRRERARIRKAVARKHREQEHAVVTYIRKIIGGQIVHYVKGDE